MSVRVIQIDPSSKHLAALQELAKRNSGTLGFLPKGAFLDAAVKRQILVAEDSSQSFLGYLLYRTTRGEVWITHLCVQEEHRHKGLSRGLFSKLRGTVQGCYGIGLWCRKDYEIASRTWRNLGFVADDERPGRAQDGSRLVRWWYDLGQATLFSEQRGIAGPTTIAVAIDSCIWISKNDPADTGHDEASALWADRLVPHVDLRVTKEIYNDILNHPDPETRQQQRKLADTILLQDGVDHDAVYGQLRNRFPDLEKKNPSDLRHLARARAAGVGFFLTRDGEVLAHADEIEEMIALRVLSPTDFIVEIDEISRTAEYEPARLAGAYSVGIRRVGSGEEEVIQRSFLRYAEGERGSEFAEVLRALLQNPHPCACYVVEGKEKSPIALVGYERSGEGKITVRLLRESRIAIAPTAIRCLISHVLLCAIREERRIVEICDYKSSATIDSAAEESGFLKTEAGWVKVSLARASRVESVISELRNLSAENRDDYGLLLGKMVEHLEGNVRKSDQVSLSRIEHVLWPAKLCDTDIPSFIVSIEPHWAENLFDEGLAGSDIFGGAKEALALNRESVYYRSPQNDGGIKVPARVLWYVKQGKPKHKWPGSGQIRACSRLDEVIVDTPKSLFRRFKRLGIYDWENVFEIAKRNTENPVMALRFSDTYLLPNPIPFREVENALAGEDGWNNLQSPILIPPRSFEDLYTLAAMPKGKPNS